MTGTANHAKIAAAEAMHRILVEKARRKRQKRHVGGLGRVNLDQVAPIDSDSSDELLALHEAPDQLATEEPMAAEVVKLRYFAGLTTDQAASALGNSLLTFNRLWALARAWLYQRLNPAGDTLV